MESVCQLSGAVEKSATLHSIITQSLRSVALSIYSLYSLAAIYIFKHREVYRGKDIPNFNVILKMSILSSADLLIMTL